MFDPQTSRLIQTAPDLPDLNRARLPEELTKAFASIVAFRLQLGRDQRSLGPELVAQLDQFRRLASTYECMVALSPDSDDRTAAAFVAAQAYHLLYLAKSLRDTSTQISPTLDEDYISSELSALLLFLIANQTSDAMEMAKIVEQNNQVMPRSLTLVSKALVYLARGQMALVLPLLRELAPLEEEPIELLASNLLYRRLLEGVSEFARYIQDAITNPQSLASAQAIFREVQREATFTLPNVGTSPSAESIYPAASVFAGPHHLASLLIAVGDHLAAAAVSAILPPSQNSAPLWRSLVQRIILTRPFLWPNHVKAIAEGLLKPGASAVISFPTGAGKTTLSELKIATALALGSSVIYLAPTHALVAQVKASLKSTFPQTKVEDSFQSEDFYAETGETFGKGGAGILVMTPERCLALLSGDESENFEKVGLVVFDECHLIHPKGSGNNRRSLDAMLAVLLLTSIAPNADWLLLSAMIANGEELAAWFHEITGRECLSLNLDWKPTRQARGCLLYESTEIQKLDTKVREARVSNGKLEKPLIGPPVALKDAMQAHPYVLFCLQQTWQTRHRQDYALLPVSADSVNLTVNSPKQNKQNWYLAPNKNEVAAQIAVRCVEKGLKVLLFTHNPIWANSIAEEINSLLAGRFPEVTLQPDEKRLLSVSLAEVGDADRLYSYRPAACHHGLLIPSERDMVEALFRRPGGIMALAATPTLAQGINLPADVVFLVGDERYDSQDKQSKQLDAHELLNAAGRAGRAGYVAQGIVIVLPHLLLAMNTNGNPPPQWFTLQKEIFSQADGCLNVSDPIQHILDKVQEATWTEDPEARYFLQRVPRDERTSEANGLKFFGRTLAAFHAKRQQASAPFDAKVRIAIERRRKLEAVEAPTTWIDEMATKTGMATAFIASLNAKILLDSSNLPDKAIDWITWLCKWLRERPQYIVEVFAHRLTKDFHDVFTEQDDLFGNRFAQMMVEWLNGATLLELNKIIKNPTKESKCPEARKFIRIVPDLAFMAGLVAKIRRKQLDLAGSEEMPLTLAVLSLCIRLGLATPELAAVRLAYRDEHISRKRVREIWESASKYYRSGERFEKFNKTRDRVNDAVMRLTNELGGLEI